MFFPCSKATGHPHCPQDEPNLLSPAHRAFLETGASFPSHISSPLSTSLQCLPFLLLLGLGPCWPLGLECPLHAHLAPRCGLLLSLSDSAGRHSRQGGFKMFCYHLSITSWTTRKPGAATPALCSHSTQKASRADRVWLPEFFCLAQKPGPAGTIGKRCFVQGHSARERDGAEMQPMPALPVGAHTRAWSCTHLKQGPPFLIPTNAP